MHNSEGSYVAFALYDSNSIKFICCENEVKIAVVPDVERPFCPLPREKLFLNIESQRDEINKILERINILLTSNSTSETNNKNNNYKNINQYGSVTGAAIFAGVDVLKGNGGRVIVFSSNACVKGAGSCKPREEKYLHILEKEKQCYIPQNNVYHKLSEECNNNKTCVDMFVIGNTQFDFPTISTISNLTGGRAYFYSVNSTSKVFNNNTSSTINATEFNQKLEKLHYDLSRILTRPNYYGCKLMLRNSLGIESQEIIGQFGRRLGKGFVQAAMDPDFCCSYNLRVIEKLTSNTNIHFQLVILYVDNYGSTYLRTFNLSYLTDNDISKIYYHVDVDAMTKLCIHKQLLSFYSQQIDKLNIRESFEKKIVEMLYYYRKKCSENSPIQQLILPASVKFIPLYLTSLLKKNFLRKNKENVSINLAYSEIIKIMRDPLNLTIKYINPKFYRIDDILEDQSEKVDDPENILTNIGLINEDNYICIKPYTLPLSIDYIDFDCKINL